MGKSKQAKADYESESSLEDILMEMSKESRLIFAALQKVIVAENEKAQSGMVEIIQGFLTKTVLDDLDDRMQCTNLLDKIHLGVTKLLENNPKALKKSDGSKPATINRWFAITYATDEKLREDYPHTEDMAKSIKHPKESTKWYESLGNAVYKSLSVAQKTDVRKYRAKVCDVAEDITPKDADDDSDEEKPRKVPTKAKPAKAAKGVSAKKKKSAGPSEGSEEESEESEEESEDESEEEKPVKKITKKTTKKSAEKSAEKTTKKSAKKSKPSEKSKTTKKAKKAAKDDSE